jgi:simple sugar transport system ATP-binding protein
MSLQVDTEFIKHGEIVLKLENISKFFPGVLANDKVTFDIYAGEILAILGENGAGKSTLMKILSGLYKPDSGSLLVDLNWFKNSPEKKELESVHFSSPNDSISLGIGMVHQHFNLVETMTVAENITLGMEFTRSKFGFSIIDDDQANNEIRAVSQQFGLEIDPNAIIEDLPVGLKQRTEILKQLYRNAKLLIFDEPTAVLTPSEVVELFRTMRELKKEGKTIIFISHKLKESLTISDRILVMRGGKLVGETYPEKSTEESLAEMMVGRRVLLRMNRKEINPGSDVLKVSELTIEDKNGRKVVDSASFTVRENEIVGVAGVQGNGQTELVNGLMGLIHKNDIKGSILYYCDSEGHEWEQLVGRPTLKILEEGIAFIPEDRSTQGIISEFQVNENSWLGYLTQPFRAYNYIQDTDAKLTKEELNRGGVLRFLLPKTLLNAFANKITVDMDVFTPNVKTSIKNLSGGNQQKVILGREFAKKPRLIIASQPTRGVDIGVTERVRNALIDMRNRGSGIFLISSDLDEVVSLSDYLLVMYEGKIVGKGPINEFPIERLSKLMVSGRE